MASREDFHMKLQMLLGDEWTLYYQSPGNHLLKYPCVLYNLANDITRYADDNAYNIKIHYQVTLMHKSPMDELIELLMRNISYCSFDRRYISDNIYHDVFNVYL